MSGEGYAGLYITVVDRSPTPSTDTESGGIPEVVGAWHGTQSRSGTFTMMIDEQDGSRAIGTISLTFPGLVLSIMPFDARIGSDGTLSFTARKGSFAFRFEGQVQGDAISGTYSGGASGYNYSGDWQGTRP
jgi:hypothetical protein